MGVLEIAVCMCLASIRQRVCLITADHCRVPQNIADYFVEAQSAISHPAIWSVIFISCIFIFFSTRQLGRPLWGTVDHFVVASVKGCGRARPLSLHPIYAHI